MSSRSEKSPLSGRFASAGGKPVYVRSMFGRIAHVYDFMNHLMTAGLDRKWRAFTAQQIALGPGQHGLDIGTGTGDLAIALARASSPQARVTGIDFTPEMLRFGKEKIARMHLASQIVLQQADGEALPFADETFDACCSAFVVRNMEHLERGFSEMLRVVKPGGRVACLEMSHPVHPVFAAGYHLYFDYVVPFLGRFVGKSFDAYSYLPTSVQAFPDAMRLKRIMEDAGWSDVRYYYRMGGVVAIHIGTRRE